VKERKVKDIKLLVMGILSPGIDTPVDFTARSRFAERPFMYESERIHGERGGQELIHNRRSYLYGQSIAFIAVHIPLELWANVNASVPPVIGLRFFC
jgi:hypothetical protein